ncbi:hypothetical protein DLAC_10574 [Tieghemostelium lacteum]|uniref:Myosin-binding domain-containing protein n=1 Tax=Tieghemostelium lacteum TaxID=361077 RepID=A0A151Z486_TIELA|nr:hypothetical protein DLAC_10574 [Tieghemostelium lacteum]|eukprot:KYQ88780.1 hypothetical protein DLAC_10574 [Tieghemostelium lacteum]
MSQNEELNENLDILDQNTSNIVVNVTKTTNDGSVHDVLFQNSQLDKYLNSLDNFNQELKGEVISFDDFNKNDNDEKVWEENQTIEQSTPLLDSKTNIIAPQNSTSRVLNSIDTSILKCYEKLNQVIIDSDLLHPKESPFINNPNLSLDTNNNISDNGGFTLVPPLHPISIYNIFTGNNSQINEEKKRDEDIFRIVGLTYPEHLKSTFTTVGKLSISIIIVLLSLLVAFLRQTLEYSWKWIIVILFIISNITSAIHFFMFLKESKMKMQQFQQNMDNVSVLVSKICKHTRVHIDQLSNSIQLIREVELISRGYRLSTPLTPIERLEHNQPIKSEKSLVLRAGITNSMRTIIVKFKEIIDQQFQPFLVSSNPHFQSFIKSDLSQLFDELDIDSTEELQDSTEEESLNLNQMESDSQLSIITIKTMLYQYELMISNFFSLLIIYQSVLLGVSSILSKPISSSMDGDVDSKVFDKIQKINQSLIELINTFTPLESRLLVETTSLSSFLSKEKWENKIPSRVIIHPTTSRSNQTLIESFLYNSNQISESLGSLSPLFSTFSDKLSPIQQKQLKLRDKLSKQKDSDDININNNNEDISVSVEDILNLDEMVINFLRIKSELSNGLKNWEISNRILLRIVRSIPIQKKLENQNNQLTDDEIKERIQRLVEKLKLNNLYFDDTENDKIIDATASSNNIDINSTENEQERIFEADADIDDNLKLEEEFQIIQSIPNSIDDNNNAQSMPPPPPPMNLPRKTKPSKRTVYDPLIDHFNQKSLNKNNNPTQPSPYSLIPPETKVITELKSILDFKTTNSKK